jgi:hypothetical protein
MKKKYLEAPDWKKKKPTDVNAPNVVEGKTYYWCNKHEMFTMHKAEECNLPKCYRFYRQTQGSKKNKNSNNHQKKGNKKGNKAGNDDKVKSDKDAENKLQYIGSTSHVGIDTDYGDY